MSFTYTPAPTPEDCTFRISPSGISRFFEMPVLWYKENFEGEEGFTGNTGSHIGDIVHEVADAVSNGREITKEEIEAFIDSIPESDAVDKDKIRAAYPGMVHALVNEYILKNQPDSTEGQLSMKISDGIYVSGTYDAYYDYGTVLDYKTAATKPNTDTIPFKYKIQALAYAKMLEASGKPVDRIRIVYIVQKTKTLPVRIFEVNHMITNEDKEMLNDTLQLMAETIELQRAHPEYIHIIYKSMALKR